MTVANPSVPRTTVIDQWHRPPSPQNLEKWLGHCLRRVIKGLTHPVFADHFTASFFKAGSELVMLGSSRDGGARFEVACRRLDISTLRRLVSQFPRAVH